MSNIDSLPFPQACSFLFLVAGTVLLIAAGDRALRAQLVQPVTGQGAFVQGETLLDAEHDEAVLSLSDAPVHAAAPAITENSGSVAVQLVVGMALVLVGFFLHALFVLKEERPVAVHAAKPKSTHNDIHSPTRRYLEVYWVEMRK